MRVDLVGGTADHETGDRHRTFIVSTSTTPVTPFPRITSDPTVLGGRAAIRGLRISVSLVLNLVANGMTPDEIVEAYPELERADVTESVRYAAWLAEDRLDVLDVAA